MKFISWWKVLSLRWRWQRLEVHQCECDSTRPAVIFDANGWKRWCVDCGGKRP